jgi:hypothetical protein
MKAAFAKLLQVDPVQSSLTDFRAGGNGVPILTRASGQSTAGYQTMGLPGGNKPFPGGGANKTVLGSIRMGDDDGNAPASAIVGDVGEIFFPYRAPDRVYPERTFPNVGNNVFQPETNDAATISLLRRLGDQKFKAESQAPFEDYRAQQRLVRDLEEASRGASLADLQQSRDIIRGIAADRRQQNEDDYLRKMLDAGATPEAARKEIEDVRNANALQEARKVDDRQYQAKMLIQRVAMARGIVPNVREPLNQSSSIDNPQRSQAMSAAMGMPGEGFGTSPLDVNRLMMTPEYYKKILRRSQVSQEASDEAVAFNNSLQGLGDQDRLDISKAASGFSMATLRGQERQQQIEIASEALASRLEALRQRQVRIKLPLPTAVVGKDILDSLYMSKGKKSGDKVLYSPETIQEINPLQVLLAINWSVQNNPNGFKNLTDEVKKYTWGTSTKPSENWLKDLRSVAYALNKNEQNIRIPFASASLSVPTSKYIELLNNIKTGAEPGLRKAIEKGRITLLEELGSLRTSDFEMLPTGENVQPTSDMTQRPLPGAGNTVVSTPDVLPASATPDAAPVRGRKKKVSTPAPTPAAAAPVVGRVRTEGVPTLSDSQIRRMNAEQVKAELRLRNIDFGNIKQKTRLQDRLIEMM